MITERHGDAVTRLLKRPSIDVLEKIAFPMFAILMAFRDILCETYLREDPVTIATLITFLLLGFAVISLSRGGQLMELFKKLKNPQIFWRALPFIILGPIVYWVTFVMIHQIGAGLFDLIDFGSLPLITTLFAMIFFREKLSLQFAMALVLYIAGLALLNWNRIEFNATMVLIALGSPVAMSISDLISAWLRHPEKGNLSRAELLFLRFFSTPFLLGAFNLFVAHKSLHLENPFGALLVAFVFGFGCIWFLSVGLGRRSMRELVIWETTIPLIVFIGTLPWHLDAYLNTKAFCGLGLVSLSLALTHDLISYVPQIRRWVKRQSARKDLVQSLDLALTNASKPLSDENESEVQ